MLGSAVDLLSEEAERVRADIVVMGAVARSRLKRLFIGSTAERVLDHLPCDVLIVKPADFTSDLPF
jgi:universal stress protein E